METVKITFDDTYNLRVYPQDKANRSAELEKESSKFVEKVSVFSENINKLVTVLEEHAARIEKQKLRAIGLRIAAENEADQRQRQQRAIQAIMNEKRIELDRLAYFILTWGGVHIHRFSRLSPSIHF